jgi:hypothetical protein
MYSRTLSAPRSAFFLFGPRGTGKSTWLRTAFPDAFVVNLLPVDAMLRYQRDHAQFRAEVLAQRRNWLRDKVDAALKDGASGEVAGALSEWREGMLDGAKSLAAGDKLQGLLARGTGGNKLLDEILSVTR